MGQMACLIPPTASILDLGCGPMWLREFIGQENRYYPVDFIKRGTETLVCDFNKHEFPDIRADISFVAGCLEYVIDHEWFIEQIANHSEGCVISYNALDHFPSEPYRRALDWVNDLTEDQLASCFRRHDFVPSVRKLDEDNGSIFKFTRV